MAPTVRAPGPGRARTEQDAGQWALRARRCSAKRPLRPAPAPAPAIVFGHNAARMEWVLHTNRDRGRTAQADPDPRPRPRRVTAKSGGQWVVSRPSATTTITRVHTVTGRTRRDTVLRAAFQLGRMGDRTPRDDCPGRPTSGSPWTQRPRQRRIPVRPGLGRITVEEAAALQSFPPGYPWQGSKTRQFRQVGCRPAAARRSCPRRSHGLAGPVAERYSKPSTGTGSRM